MFDDSDAGQSAERAVDPAARAKEKSEELRTHAELAAIFEGRRKFDAEIVNLSDELARDIQRRIARLEKTRSPESPVLPASAAAEAAELLVLGDSGGLRNNDYHIRRRPGELIIVRWLTGEQVETFYQRMQAHFNVGLEQVREDERQEHGWKQDRQTSAYLAALDAIELRMADRYLRDGIRQHHLFVLSTLTADEMDILHLSDYLIGISPAELVGAAAAPPDEPTERDRAWFFKLFSLRGMVENVERMCFFAYLQKAEDTFDLD